MHSRYSYFFVYDFYYLNIRKQNNQIEVNIKLTDQITIQTDLTGSQYTLIEVVYDEPKSCPKTCKK